jgi:hypothetical protein
MDLNSDKPLKGIQAGKLVKCYRLSRRLNESPDAFKSIKINSGRRMTSFCPFCKGENIKSALDERPEWLETRIKVLAHL